MRAIAELGLAASLMTATPAAAASWRVAAIGGDAPDRSVFLVDTESVRRNGESIRFWTQTIMERVDEERDWDRSVTLREGSCAEHSTAIIQNSFYRGGEHVETDRERLAPVFHQPGSMMHGVMETACGRRDYVTEGVGDPEPVVRAFFAETD
jgi:hypothetical protein